MGSEAARQTGRQHVEAGRLVNSQRETERERESVCVCQRDRDRERERERDRERERARARCAANAQCRGPVICSPASKGGIVSRGRFIIRCAYLNHPPRPSAARALATTHAHAADASGGSGGKGGPPVVGRGGLPPPSHDENRRWTGSNRRGISANASRFTS
jgi:hypothetical protein